MVTAAAAFKILDQASDPIKKITDAGAVMDKTMNQAGKSLDKIDSPQVTGSLKTTERNVKSLGDQSTRAGQQIEQMSDKTNRAFDKMATGGTAKIEELTTALKRFEHERATAKLDVDIAKAEAKIRLVKHELRTFTTMEAQKELEDLGLIAQQTAAKLGGTGVGGGGGGPPGIGGSLASGFFAAGGRAAFMGAAILAALPAIVALTGAVSALVGSLGAAAGGAGALGIGTMGAFVVGIGAIVAAVKPAITELKNVKDAQDKYNQAVTQYGRRSAQALQAEKQLTALRRKSPGAADVLRNAGVLSNRFRRQTRPARADVFGILNEGLATAMADLPTFSRIVNHVMDSARDAVTKFLAPFRGPEWRGIFTTLGDTFARITGPAAGAFGNVLMWLGRVAQAASPMVVRMFDALERWTSSLADRVANREATARTIERLVGQLRDWVRFGGAAVRLMAQFFGAGAAQGQSMVQSMTDTLNHWTAWLREHPDEVHDFFRRTIDATGKLVDALGHIAVALGQIGDALLPVLSGFSQLVSLVGGAGALGPLAVLGGARFALGRGFGLGRLRGAMGGAGAAVGGEGAVAAAAAGGTGAGLGTMGRAGRAITGYRQWRAIGADRGVAAAEAFGGARGAALGVGRAALRGAGRFALPLAAGMAAWDFATYQGNVLQRTQNALHGATFGLIPGPHSAVNERDAGRAAVQQFMGRQPGVGTVGDRVRTLEASLARRVGPGTQAMGRGGVITTAAHFAIQGGERQRVQAQLDALRPVLHAQVEVKASRQGLAALDDLTKAFETRWQSAGSRAARMGLVHDLEAQMKDLGPKGKRALLAGVADWTATLDGGNRRQKLAAEAAKNQIVSIYRSMGQAVAVVQGKIVALNANNWKTIADNVSTAANRAAYEATGAFTDIMNAASRALRLMGFSGRESRGIVEGLTQGGRSGRYAQNAVDMGAAQLHGNADKAQRIGDGWGMGDGPGDPFGKRAAATARTSVARGMGGSGGLMGAKAGLQGYADVAGRMGLHVSSGLRPGAITNAGNVSFHSSGDAIDLAGSPDQMRRFALYAASHWGRHLEELIYSPLGWSLKNGRRVAPYAVADHYDHVHIADTAPGGGGGGVAGTGSGRLRLPRRRSHAGGALGIASQRANDIISSAVESRINNILSASTGGLEGAGAGGRQSAGGAYDKAGLARLWRTAGGPGNVAQLMGAIALAESGGNPRAHNPSGASGLWQILGVPFAGNVWDPLTNARMAVAKYRSQGLGAWEAYTNGMYKRYAGDGWGRSGTTNVDWGGWFGRGGSFTAHKPTMIGVGEAGSERVTVRPTAVSSTATMGGRRVHVHIENLHNFEEGDISDILERELSKVADDLDRGDDEDELG